MTNKSSDGRAGSAVAPDFVVIGAQRCGTTWMQRCMIEHPDIYVRAWRTEDVFLDEMAGYNDESLIGVFDATILTDPGVPDDLKALASSVKLLAVVRNPVDRAYSWYHQRLRQGDDLYATEPTFTEALKEDPDLITNGIYTPHLRRHMDLVGESRLWVGVFDDLRAEPLQFLGEVLQFLGIEETSNLPSRWADPVNYSAVVRNRRLHRLARGTKSATRRLLGLRNQWIIDRIERSRMVTAFKRANETRTILPLDDGTRADLYQTFADDITDLESFLGRDLSNWKPIASGGS